MSRLPISCRACGAGTRVSTFRIRAEPRGLRCLDCGELNPCKLTQAKVRALNAAQPAPEAPREPGPPPDRVIFFSTRGFISEDVVGAKPHPRSFDKILIAGASES